MGGFEGHLRTVGRTIDFSTINAIAMKRIIPAITKVFFQNSPLLSYFKRTRQHIFHPRKRR